MKAIFAFGLLVLIAFLGSQFLFKRKKLFLPLSYFFLSGLIYVFLGLSLGKNGLNVLSPGVLEGLNPLISLGLGWVGFIFGFQLEYAFAISFCDLSCCGGFWVAIKVSFSLRASLSRLWHGCCSRPFP
jgi:hypothetical protein